MMAGYETVERSMRTLSGAETLNRQGRQYVGSWVIRGADITISVPGIGRKTVPVGASASIPQGLVRQTMARMIDDFESDQGR
jgi:hypothetical protein